MPATTPARITLGDLIAQQQLQQEALQELIDIALGAIRESSDSSVAGMHLMTRLSKLSDALRQSAAGLANAQRSGESALHH